MAESALSDRKTLGDASEVMKLCDALEEELAMLRGNYEQYFLGVERRPPTDKHEAIKKKLQQIRNTFVRQTNAKFRVNNLQNKFATYERLWMRTLKEMEDGTYRRDVFKARLRRQQLQKQDAAAGKKPAAPDLSSEDVDLDDLDDDTDAPMNSLAAAVESAAAKAAPKATAPMGKPAAAAPATAPAAAPKGPVTGAPPTAKAPGTVPAPAKPGSGPLAVPAKGVGPSSGSSPLAVSARPAGPASGSHQVAPLAATSATLSDQKVKAIYDAYVLAKKRCNEDTSKLSVDGLASTLRKQVPELMKQHNAKSVEFKVVIKDGRAILRALPKE